MSSSALTAEHVGHRFGPRILFRDLSFSLSGGESLAVTGPNGSGKSTLLLILAGLLTPRRGRIELRLSAGHAVERVQHPLRCGFMAPRMNVYGGLTALENLMFIARARRLAGGPERASELLERMGLSARAEDPVSTFSSGMIQRMKLACALLPEPELLLLDEPTVTLDAAGHEVVQLAVADHLATGGMVVLATNVPAEADFCQRSLDLT
ncbi:MAG: heme ABC exporter ATP-binding protein CcmA [Bacteroidetes bacterium CG12_big_fil_rev_8_21_14_0_65_60_17]|nr:MAG: heme ABC exporter ATP-binding protein CcmA [Bacteroidetes bacterium CG12_big_fil_rev_8_21_14_0_65_60_17]